MNASEELLHALLKRGTFLESFTDAQLQALLPILERAHDEILGRIARTGGQWTREWLAQEAADIDAIYKTALDQIQDSVMQGLQGLAAEEASWVSDEAGKILVGVSLSTPGAGSLWAAISALPAFEGSTLGQLFTSMKITTPTEVIQAIQLGMAEGETVDQMVKRLRGAAVKPARWIKDAEGNRVLRPGVYEGGAMTTTTRDAEMLVRTGVMHVGNQAREELYRQNQDIIKGYQYVATLDLDTCLVCGESDGMVYSPEDARPELPRHPRCRCLWTPVLKSFRDIGVNMDQLPPSTRASMDGQVPEFETYADRLAKTSPERRVAMLGPARAKLYDQGIPLDAMVREGKQIPLSEISTTKKKGAAA